MEKVNPSMRLKMKRDTFYLPEPNKGVYLRNNSVSFRLEGSGIDKWVEKLLPMFNGEYTLGKLTDGLPGPYRNRVFEIADVLYRNGFVRDVSQDEPHHLSEQVLKKFASQIEFIDNLVGSGAARFQAFRDANILAAGSGPFLSSLVSSLLESGVAKVNVLITDEAPTNRNRLRELVDNARKTDPEVGWQEITLENQSFREALQSFDSVLYLSQSGNLEELVQLQSVCIQEKKNFIPALFLKQTGIAGPLVSPDSDVCWESAWRRLHSTVFEKDQQIPAASATSGALLANIITFELFKEKTDVPKTSQNNRIFLLDLETLEGSWHSFLPHPLETAVPTAKRVEEPYSRLEQESTRETPEKLLQYFSLLTSKETGVLHLWEEGDLKQLPLAQCRVQAVDPLSEGPAELMEQLVCSAFTHEEARKEAALTGIEAYASRFAGLLQNGKFLGVGAGETFAEAVGRGLEKCLVKELSTQEERNCLSLVEIEAIEDQRCSFYLEALRTMQGPPDIGIGKEVSGFPVIWVGSRNGWYGSTGMNLTMALRSALQQALFRLQNNSNSLNAIVMDESSLYFEERMQSKVTIPSCEKEIQPHNLKQAMEVLERNGKQLLVYELKIEPVFNEELEGVFGVLLREEGMR